MLNTEDIQPKIRQLLESNQKKILQYVCLVSSPLWIIWILFDYLFAPEVYTKIAVIRILCSFLDLTLGMLVLKQVFKTSNIQLIYFVHFQIAISIMFLLIGINSYAAYFIGFSMILILMFLILIIEMKQYMMYLSIVFFTFIILMATSKYVMPHCKKPSNRLTTKT